MVPVVKSIDTIIRPPRNIFFVMFVFFSFKCDETCGIFMNFYAIKWKELAKIAKKNKKLQKKSLKKLLK